MEIANIYVMLFWNKHTICYYRLNIRDSKKKNPPKLIFWNLMKQFIVHQTQLVLNIKEKSMKYVKILNKL